MLLGALDLYHESLSVLVGTLHINPDRFAVLILVSALFGRVGEAGNPPLGDKSLKKQEHEAAGISVLLERTFEPAVKHDVGVASGAAIRSVFHNTI